MNKPFALPLFAALAAALTLISPALAARVTVPGTSISVAVPAGFAPMPASVIASKYARGTPPSSVYSTPGPGWEANIAFALSNQSLPAGSLASVQTELERSIQGAPGFKWVKHGVVKSGGREWVDLQFWVSAPDTTIYNHLRVTREGQKTLYVTANVTKRLYSKYGAALDAAMNGLK
jgi:hypothetical protein